MKTPWMQTNYSKLNDDEYIIEYKSNKVLLSLANSTSSFCLTSDEFDKFKENKLDPLLFENLYYRGLAVDDEGYRVQSQDSYLKEEKYFPLSSDQYTSFDIKTANNKYTIVLNPEIGSWVAFEDDECFSAEEMTANSSGCEA